MGWKRRWGRRLRSGNFRPGPGHLPGCRRKRGRRRRGTGGGRAREEDCVPGPETVFGPEVIHPSELSFRDP